jgi:hypothetical protein
MKRSLFAVAVALVAAAVLASGAMASNVIHIDGVDISTPPALNDYWSGVCGFDIYYQTTGHQDTTLVLNQDGLVVSQIATVNDDVFTLTAPENGTRMDWASPLVWHFSYPEGATLGAPVDVSVTGLNSKIVGLPADAGLQLYTGHVTGFVGPIPQWEGIFGGATWIARIGHWNDSSQVSDAICTALATS